MKCFVTFTAFALFFGAEEMTQQFIDGGHDAYFCRRTTPVVRSVTRIWQCSHRRHVMCSLPHLSVQFITVLFIPLERSIARINEAAVRRGVWKFSYLNERFHDCVDRQIVGGREQMRTDKESTQVSDILCWKGRRFPAGTVGSEAQHTSPLVDCWSASLGSLCFLSSSQVDLNKTGWVTYGKRAAPGGAICEICWYIFLVRQQFPAYDHGVQNHQKYRNVPVKYSLWNILINTWFMATLKHDIMILVRILWKQLILRRQTCQILEQS